MKTKTLASLLLIYFVFSVKLFAYDIYAEYKMSGIGEKSIISKLYMKDGNVLSEVKMDVAGKEMTSYTLNLKNNAEYSYSYNSFSKSYTEVKKNSGDSKTLNLSVEVLGSEKIGAYACKHIRMKSDTSSWDMWMTKDLPAFEFPIDKNNDAANRKIMELLKSKSADGFPVKIAFLKPGSNTPTITMELIKYESKNLDASLFEIPAGYTKNTANFDSEKMKNMSPEEQKEMIKKMMEEYMPKK